MFSGGVKSCKEDRERWARPPRTAWSEGVTGRSQGGGRVGGQSSSRDGMFPNSFSPRIAEDCKYKGPEV